MHAQLLAAVGIIALRMALLAGALAEAKAKARRVACLSNLRRLQAAYICMWATTAVRRRDDGEMMP
jgi:hypothetical protein